MLDKRVILQVVRIVGSFKGAEGEGGGRVKPFCYAKTMTREGQGI